MLAHNPEASRVIQQMESEYDRVQAGDYVSESVPLSPEVEKFLREMGNRLEEYGQTE